MQCKLSMILLPWLLLAGCGVDADDDTAPAIQAVTGCAATPVASWSASGNDGNVPQNAGDSNVATRWSSLGVGQFITADLGSPRLLCALDIAWYNGNTRTNRFVISGSSDGATFTPIATGTSSGTTTAAETYAVTALTARYVRVTVNGNSVNDWASIAELAVSAASPGCPTTATRRIAVTSAATLASALAGARAGDVIQMADGVYAAKFTASASGTASAPIALCGSRNAILDSNGGSTGFKLTGSFWTLAGFTVRNASLGLVLDAANHNLLTNLEVHHTGQEGIHFRTNSSFNTLQSSFVHDTGTVTPGFGEGVYIGSAVSNWPIYTGGNPDRSDHNQVLNNTIGPTAAESIDIKEGTTGGVIRGNTMIGTRMSGANFSDSCAEVKGNAYTINDNRCSADAPTSLVNGFQVKQQVAGWGLDNTFSNNHMTGVPSGKVGITVASVCRATTVVHCNNTVNAGAAVTDDTPCNP